MSEPNPQPLIKFQSLSDMAAGVQRCHQWPAHYHWQHLEEVSRLRVAIPGDPIQLIFDLISLCKEPYGVLHVISPALRGESGRYQLKSWLGVDDLSRYLQHYGAFLTQDGRQETWIRGEDGQLIYDNHETLFLYGPLEAFEDILLQKGFTQAEFSIGPHRHNYHSEFDEDEAAITLSDDYAYWPLNDGDME